MTVSLHNNQKMACFLSRVGLYIIQQQDHASMPIFYIELLKLFFIVSFSIGAWTCINLILNRRSDSYIRSALIIYVLVLLISPINAYINLLQLETSNFLTLLSQKLSWVYGPLLMILIDRLLLKKINGNYIIWHFLPFLFFYPGASTSTLLD